MGSFIFWTRRTKMEKAKIVCHKCGTVYVVEHAVAKKDFLYIEKDWGYFSKKDGEHHSLVLCEACYDRFIKTLMIPPVITERTEYLS